MTSPSRARKRQRSQRGSGLKGIQLFNTLTSLRSLRELLDREDEHVAEEDLEQIDDETIKANGQVMDTLDDLIDMLQAKVDGPLNVPFSLSTIEHLQNHLNIKESGMLSYDTQSALKRGEQESVNGGAKYMSSRAMHDHLNFLNSLVPRINEAASRLWIDTIFFRVAAMTSDDNVMVLHLEHIIPSLTVPVPQESGRRIQISGTIDYTAVLTPPGPLQLRLLTATDNTNTFNSIKTLLPNGLYVAEAKFGTLEQHVPQAISEMNATARHLKKTIIRGAITNGLNWIFLILHLYEAGGYFRRSVPIPIDYDPATRTLRGTWPDMIAGIVSYWINHSFDDIDKDDWFTVIERELSV